MKTIAILSAVGIGDIITMCPLLKKLKTTYPACQITIFSSIPGFFKHEQIDYIENIIVYSKISDLPKLYSHKFDLLIGWGEHAQLKGFIKKTLYKVLFLTFPAKQKISFSQQDANQLKDQPIYAIRLNILKKLNITLKEEDYQLHIPYEYKNTREHVIRFLKTKGVDQPTDLIIIHPSVQKIFSTKLWINESWNQVIEYLSKKTTNPIAIIGVNDDTELIHEITKNIDQKVVDLSGELSLQETTALISLCKLYISCNSGPMWIAAALNKPQIILSGPSKAEWHPKNPKAHILQTILDRKHCNPPCNELHCFYKDTLCMHSITPENVIQTINSSLQKRD